MADNQISFEVVLDDGSIKKAFLKFGKDVEKAGEESGNLFGESFSAASIAKTTAGITAAVAATAAVIGALSFKKAISEAIEAENAINQFNAALFSTGNFTKEASQSFQDYASSLERTLGIQDELILQGGQLLVTIGNLTGQGLERATQASLDLAKGLQIDTTTAFNLLAKAANGNVGALSRYGIKIDENLSKSQKFAEALRLIEGRFNGMAAAASGTLQGSLNRVTIEFNNIFETFGKLITSSPVIREALKIIANEFVKISDSLSKISVKSFDGIILKMLEMAQTASLVLLPAIEIIGNTLKTVFTAVELIVGGIVNLIGELASGFAQVGNAVGLVSDETERSLLAFAEASNQETQEQFKGLKDSILGVFNTDTSAAINQTIDTYIQKLNQAKDTGTLFKDQTLANNEDIKGSLYGVGQAFSDVATGIKDASLDMAENASKNFKALGRTMLQSIGQGAGQAFAAFGGALAKGEDALAAFGDALLKAFGNALIQLGTGFILQGIAQSIAGFGSGAPLIAAGAALAAFGGLIAASSGGGGASAGGGVAASGGGGLATEPSSTTSFNEEENAIATPQTSVAVNIQGNVLDRRQTGLELVEVLQDAFDTQGAQVVGANV